MEGCRVAKGSYLDRFSALYPKDLDSKTSTKRRIDNTDEILPHFSNGHDMGCLLSIIPMGMLGHMNNVLRHPDVYSIRPVRGIFLLFCAAALVGCSESSGGSYDILLRNVVHKNHSMRIAN